MRVSAIVPEWQRDGTLGACLDSVRDSIARYRGEVEFELVVLNGRGSVAADRNAALALATGDYVAWIDADDEVFPGWAERIAAALGSGPDIVTFNARMEWWNGRKPAILAHACRRGDFFRALAAGRIPGQLWCKVFRRSLFEGLEFRLAIHEDYLIELEMAARESGRQIEVVDIPVPLYRYVRRADGLSQYGTGDSAAVALGELIGYASSLPDGLRQAAIAGVSVRVADFLRNARQVPSGPSARLRRFLRANLGSLLFSSGMGIKARLKCILAGVGK